VGLNGFEVVGGPEWGRGRCKACGASPTLATRWVHRHETQAMIALPDEDFNDYVLYASSRHELWGEEAKTPIDSVELWDGSCPAPALAKTPIDSVELWDGSCPAPALAKTPIDSVELWDGSCPCAGGAHRHDTGTRGNVCAAIPWFQNRLRTAVLHL
jgi:hypothetical protein